ncbi:MAG: hypothetical protein NTZ19_16760 [Bacteroidetes bacterium]|nr:hypothetical protein [Bacteroidota bacterium]
MSKKLFLLFMVIVPFSFISTQVKAQSKASTIVVDGLDEDWKNNVFNVDSANGFEYSVMKNDTQLFFIIRFINKLNQIKSLTTGMQIGFDMYQKNKSQQYIYFPLDNSSKANHLENLADLSMMQYSLLLFITEYELKKFTNGNGVYKYDAENPNGIKIAFAANKEDMLVYEYSIPLESLRNKKDAPGLTSTQVEIEIFIPAFRMPSQSTSTGNETGAFNTRFGVTPSAKQNKVPSRSGSGGPNQNSDIKTQYKDFFETTKKKILITF